MSDVPEVEISPSLMLGHRGYWFIECRDENCDYEDLVNSEEIAEEDKAYHIKWHEEGMPE